MTLDNIQAVNEETRVKPDASLSTNSIKFKQASFQQAMQRVKELKARRDSLLGVVEKEVADAVADNTSETVIIEDNKSYAKKIATLEQEIKILEGTFADLQGPLELVDKRAIRLINQMITTAKENSKGVYRDLNKNAALASETMPTESNIDVQKIVEQNSEPVAESVEAAIKEETLNEDSIKNAFDEALGMAQAVETTEPVIENVVPVVETTEPVIENVVPVVEATEPVIENVVPPVEATEPVIENVVPVVETTEPVIENVVPVVETTEPVVGEFDTDELTRIINEKLSLSNEYVPMTDEQIAESRKKLGLDEIEKQEKAAYEKYFAEKESKQPVSDEIEKPLSGEYVPMTDEEVAESRKKLGLDEIEKPLRDNPIVVEERREPVVEKSYVVTGSEKWNLREERKRQILEERRRRAELESEANSVNLDIENQRRINAQVTAEEDEARKARDRVIAEREQIERELDETLDRELASLRNGNESIVSDIQQQKHVRDGIVEDTETKRRNKEDIEKQNRSTQDEIARYKEEISTMLGGNSNPTDIYGGQYRR